MNTIIKPFYIARKRYKETEARACVGVEGWYTIRAIKPGFGVMREASFPNLITNSGLDVFGGAYGSFFRYMVLGTGTAAPTVTDTGLTNFGVRIANQSSSDKGNNSVSPYYAWHRQTFRSAVGGATGVWTEIGVERGTGGAVLSSHALILDGGGAPTSFPVLADEQFEGTYELRFYAPTADDVRSISLSGTSYSATTRAALVTASDWDASKYLAGGGAGCYRYAGGVGAVTGVPGGGTVGGGETSALSTAYSNGTYYGDAAVRWGAGSPGVFRSILFRFRSAAFQIEYDPGITQLTSEEFIHNQRISWARR